MNDLFFKFIEKLGSIDNTLLFAVSIIPYAIFLFYLYKIKSVNNFVKTGFSLTVRFSKILGLWNFLPTPSLAILCSFLPTKDFPLKITIAAKANVEFPINVNIP